MTDALETSYKPGLEKKMNAEEWLLKTRGNITNKILNFSVGYLFSVAGAIGGGKMAWYGTQSKDLKSFCVGTALLGGGTAATIYCYKKIKKGFRILKEFY